MKEQEQGFDDKARAEATEFLRELTGPHIELQEERKRLLDSVMCYTVANVHRTV